MMESRTVEFFLTPDGDIMVYEEGQGTRQYTEKDTEFSMYILNLVQAYYPEAYMALHKEYQRYKGNAPYFVYKMASRFIRCNFGKYDGLTYDIQGITMHLEEVACPQRRECPMAGVICKPKALALTDREREIAILHSKGLSYKDISEQLGITHSTIKNFLQRIKKRLHLRSSKDIAKVLCTIIIT